MIDNSPAPIRLVNADALGEALKFLTRRPRLKSYARSGQARHFATHTQGLFRSHTIGGAGVAKAPMTSEMPAMRNARASRLFENRAFCVGSIAL